MERDTSGPQRRENFAFTAGGTLFIGVTLVAVSNTNVIDWKALHAQDLAWTQQQLAAAPPSTRAAVIVAQAAPTAAHDDYFKPLKATVAAFARPVMYLHGDLHAFYCKKQPAWPPNVVDVQVDSGEKVAGKPLGVTVTGDPRGPFLLDRQALGTVSSATCQ